MKSSRIFQMHLLRNSGIILSGLVLETPAFAQTYSAFLKLLFVASPCEDSRLLPG